MGLNGIDCFEDYLKRLHNFFCNSIKGYEKWPVDLKFLTTYLINIKTGRGESNKAGFSQ